MVKKKISVCIPCYNEINNIALIYSQLKEEMDRLLDRYDYEIVFEDNCSTDGTKDELRKLASEDKKVKVIFNLKNFGAMRNSGYIMFQATGDAVIGMPCDLQTPTHLIPDYIRLWEEGYQVVLGQIAGSKENKIMYCVRSLYYKIIGAFSENRQFEHVTGCGLFDRHALKLIEALNEPDPNFRYAITDLGLKTALIPYTQEQRKNGKSSYSISEYFNQALETLIATSKMPMRLATKLGALITGLSFTGIIAYLIVMIVNWSTFYIGIGAILLAISFFAGVLLTFLGVLGEYVIAVLYRLKNIPLVVEDERINFDKE